MYKLITAPAIEPIDLTEAKAHLRVTGTDEENLISNLIVAVRQEAENYLNRALITQTWDYYLDEFPADNEDDDYSIIINKCPVQSISSINYYDGDGSLQTWATTEYKTDVVSEPCRVQLAYGKSYPTTRSDYQNAVIVRFLTGYGNTGASVPDAIKAGMYLYLSWLYDNRGDTPTSRPARAIYDIWNNYRVLVL